MPKYEQILYKGVGVNLTLHLNLSRSPVTWWMLRDLKNEPESHNKKFSPT